MTARLIYFLGAIIAIPLLPILYIQSLIIRAKVPKLPEAEEEEGIFIHSPASTLRIISIGESTVAGVGAKTHKEALTGTFAAELGKWSGRNVSWRVYAKSGYSAAEVADVLLDEIEEEELDLILIGLGGNDAFELNTPQKWIKNIDRILIHLREKYPQTPIAFLNMPPIKLFPAFTSLIKCIIGNLGEILGQELATYVQKHERVYYYARKISEKDWNDRLKINKSAEELFSDGVHPALFTYQIWAKDMMRFLVEETDFPQTLQGEKLEKTS